MKHMLTNSTFLHLWGLHKAHKLHGPAAHVPGLDIVLPPLASVNGVASQLNPLTPRINKTIMFFHAGSICRDGNLRMATRNNGTSCMGVLVNGTDDDFKAERWSYSGGVRQYVYRHFRDLPGYKIVTVRCKMSLCCYNKIYTHSHVCRARRRMSSTSSGATFAWRPLAAATASAAC